MSVTSGFFNSLNNDRRYNAEQMSALFDGIINDGVFANIGTCFGVQAYNGNTIIVGVGRAWFNSAWLYNDAPLPILLDDSELILDRYDAVVIEINHDDPVRDGTIKILKGTPSSSPNYPSMTKSNLVNQYPLAYIYRKANSTSVTQSNITNAVGTSDCPFVTGVLEVTDIDNIVAQWEAQWNEWYAAEVATASAEQRQWLDSSKAEYDAWFAAIKGTLGTDPATQLAAEIMRVENDAYGFKGTLTSKNDLDKLLIIGIYSYSTSNVPLNAPYENASIVEVFGSKSESVQKIQRVTRYGVPGFCKWRCLTSGVWTAWSEVYTENNKPTADDIGAVSLNGGTKISKCSLNDVKTPGNYYGSFTDNVTDGPPTITSGSFYMFVRDQYNSGEYIEQNIVMGGSFSTIRRRWNGYSWSAWVASFDTHSISIPSGDDLNNYALMGCYYITATASKDIRNIPRTIASHLYVFRADAQDAENGVRRILQIVTPTSVPDAYSEIYYRKHADGVWSSWYTVATTDKVLSKNGDTVLGDLWMAPSDVGSVRTTGWDDDGGKVVSLEAHNLGNFGRLIFSSNYNSDMLLLQKCDGKNYRDYSLLHSGNAATLIQSLLNGGNISVIKKIQRGVVRFTSIDAKVTLSGFTNLNKMVVLIDGIGGASSTNGNPPYLKSLSLTELAISCSFASTSYGDVSYQVVEYA